jgi:peptidoglycan hydrolase-like protein with peptidoglycan-binding domain
MADKQEINNRDYKEGYTAGRDGDGGSYATAQFFGVNSESSKAGYRAGYADYLKHGSRDGARQSESAPQKETSRKPDSHSSSSNSSSESYSSGGSYRSYSGSSSSSSSGGGGGVFAGILVVCIFIFFIIVVLSNTNPANQQQSYHAPPATSAGVSTLVPNQPVPPESRPTDPDIAAVQSALARRGFSPGDMDGFLSPQTLAAIRSFQISLGERATGELTATQRETLFMSRVPSGGRTSPAQATQLPPPIDLGSMPEFDPTIQAIQHALIKRGFDPGPPDGLVGPRTRRAIRDFQLSRGEPGTEILTSSQQSALIGAAVAATRPTAVISSPLAGNWIGSVFQIPAGTQQTYPVKMIIFPDGGGTIDYPSLGCGGTLSVEARSQGVMTLRERITYGRNRCIDQGVVELRRAGSRVEWTWTGSGYIARSSLSQTP